ncbi:ATP-binding cassette domain-containing protein [Candidatus Haliotispira prima]|uniref:Ribose/galactose/methyl galactoside import ATP-binding protein n=1 Tax=Candidatus Haliotispira prima TaxID=3034016 RepID=A0ABY8MIZ1_9SPIO|nr:ATP-binding cassette domain-containing protein [Candidatus Haliotispira prima]
MEDRYLLSIKNVNKSFAGVQVLKDVSMDVRPGTVHSLMGENGAGKSTLMKCLFGIYKQDSGQFFLDGTEFDFTDANDALQHGVSMVHQELNQVLQRNVVDNIWLGRYPGKLGLVDDKKMRRDTEALFERLGVDVDLNRKLVDLSVSQRQMIEIAKAVSYNAQIIVLDEPTSSLTENEVDKLFEIITTLKNSGCGIIYISHKMDEIFRISDDVTIMRDGEYEGTYPVSELDMDKIIKLMVGRDLVDRFPPKTNVPGAVVAKFCNMVSEHAPRVNDISFSLRKGEILGIYGLIGARRTELLELIFGLREKRSGTIYYKDKEIDNQTPQQSIRNGFILVTEERRANGIFAMANLNSNITVANLPSYVRKVGILDLPKMKADTDRQMASLKVKGGNQKSLIYELSGGNQQKVILARWLLLEPDILLLDEPTRGIDVGAKYEIYQLIIKLAEAGKSVIMVSSEMPELLGVTDRMMVMSNGYLSDILETNATNQHEVLTLATKYL